MNGEISFDLVMESNMDFIEGTYRVDGGPWNVFIFKRDGIETPQIAPARWDSGVEGVLIRYPRTATLDKDTAQSILGTWLNVSTWFEVKGPDSMNLR